MPKIIIIIVLTIIFLTIACIHTEYRYYFAFTMGLRIRFVSSEIRIELREVNRNRIHISVAARLFSVCRPK